MGVFSFEGWTSGIDQRPGMWFQIEMPESKTISEVQYYSPPKRQGFGRDALPPLPTYPMKFSFQKSLDGQIWETVLEDSTSDQTQSILTFDPVQAKFLKIIQTGGPGTSPWVMRELKIYGK